MEELFEENLPTSIDDLKINVNEWGGSIILKKHIFIYLNDFHHFVSISGEDEIWVKGVTSILQKFFNNKKAVYLKINEITNFIFCLFAFYFFYLCYLMFSSNNYMLSIILFLIAIFFIYFHFSKKRNKLFPFLKINLTYKTDKKIDKNFICNIILIIIAVATLIVAILK